MSSCVKGHCQSHLCGKMEKEKWGKWRNKRMWKLGKIVSALIPRVEAFCRSCLNSIEERTANDDGCRHSFTLSTRKQEKLKNKYIKKKKISFEGRYRCSRRVRMTKDFVPNAMVQRSKNLDCKFRWAGINYGFKKSLAKVSLFVKKFLGALTIQTMTGKESSRNSHHTPFHTFIPAEAGQILWGKQVCAQEQRSLFVLCYDQRVAPSASQVPTRCGRSHPDNQTSQMRLGQWPAEVLRNLSTPSWKGKSNQMGILCFKKGAFLENRQIATST